MQFRVSSLALGVILCVLAVYDSQVAIRFEVLTSFDGTNGARPHVALVQGKDGSLSSGGGKGYHGTVFKISARGSVTALVSFDGINGGEPWAGLTADGSSNFYGSSREAGSNIYGAIF